jgi:hypothetical protein
MSSAHGVLTNAKPPYLVVRKITYVQFSFVNINRLCKSANDDWRLEDGLFNKQEFFNMIVALFEDDADDELCVETLAWWNTYAFLFIVTGLVV